MPLSDYLDRTNVSNVYAHAQASVMGGICVGKREGRFIYCVHEVAERCRWQGLMNDAGICTIYAVWAKESFNQIRRFEYPLLHTC